MKEYSRYKEEMERQKEFEKYCKEAFPNSAAWGVVIFIAIIIGLFLMGSCFHVGL
jgi:hypothetical protein